MSFNIVLFHLLSGNINWERELRSARAPSERRNLGVRHPSTHTKLHTCLITARLPWGLSGKESSCRCRRPRFNPSIGQIPWRRKWQPTPVFWPEESHGHRSLVGSSPWGRKRVGHDLAAKQQQLIPMDSFFTVKLLKF